ncbi:hypothetical protein H2200_003832 [Cladophialophora chaetospira]|uniref:Glycosyltransferase family 62 protein n=1 Tax=Cladophialophora chaetospira TaxID=386627 RepID=A0AA38XEZ1_9EURO|nr:hypothetical protein H2200_003832 [Cladophialophora chaetospira]
MTSLFLSGSRARLLVTLGLLAILIGATIFVFVDPTKVPDIGLLSNKSTCSISTSPSPELLQAQSHESVEPLADGAIRYERVESGTEPDILWLVLTYDRLSWGRLPSPALAPQRSFDDFLLLLTETNIDAKNISLGLMTSSAAEFQHYVQATKKYHFARLTIILHAGFDTDAVVDREHRHDDESQKARRSELAQLRNYLMLSSLTKERHVVWLDADVYYLDEGIIQRMVSHAESREDVGIITARCEAPWGPNYDLNAWAGSYKHERVVTDVVKDTTDDDLLPLTAVGATLLYIRASLVRRGVNFPCYYAVNTKWREDGDDGIESEGMCYQARGLKGGGCFILGGSWHTKHGD